MEESKRVRVSNRKVDMTSVICQNSRDSLAAFVKRLEIDIEPTWDKEVFSVLIRDMLLNQPESLIFVYGRATLEFLIELWESDEIELYPSSWTALDQLKLFGFVDISQASLKDNKDPVIYMVQEARDKFYYYLKSKTAKAKMDYYSNWEIIIRGLLSYYGIISTNQLYCLFCRAIKEPVDDISFYYFLYIRMDLFHFASIVLAKNRLMEYYKSYEVTDAANVLRQRQQIGPAEYYLPTEEDLLYPAQNSGLGNWDGIRELAEILIDLMQVEYYETVIIIKACIVMLQNGESPQMLEDYLLRCCPEIQKFQDKMKAAVLSLYDSVPIFSLRGWSRKKLRKRQRDQIPFRLIQGGKQDREEE